MENNCALPKESPQGKYIILNGPESKQGSPEWKSFRNLKIGASMAGTIMAENPYQTPLQLFEQILCGEEVFVNEAMIRGNALEPLAREWFNTMRGLFFKTFDPVVIQSTENPWLIASLDGYRVIADGKIEILEIKCGEKTFAEIAMGACPKQYYGQLQHQMMITGLNEAYLCAFDGEVGAYTTVFRDNSYILSLFEAEKDFHRRLMELDVPEPSDSDYEVVVSNAAHLQSYFYQKVCTEIKELEERKEFLRKDLISYCTNKRSKIGDLKICKSVRKGAIQYDKIEVLKGIDLEPYRKQNSEYWSIK